jgi:iron complex outermembrane receptor protein
MEVKAQVSGTVVDASNRSPLPGATVIGNGKVTITDPGGRFTLEVSSFPVHLEVSYVGYDSRRILINKTTTNPTIELSASNFLLGEVVITAYDKKQTILESPGSISLITGKDLKQDNDVTIVPALNRIPGIYMHSGTYNTSRLTIRGIGSRSLFATSKIRAYYEGIPLTSGDGETTVEDIDPNLIDRIEIIKGPSSSLYGAGLGGTLLLKSKAATGLDRSLKYQITGGSYGYLKNAIHLGYGKQDHRLSVSLNHILSDGWRENNQFKRFSSGLTYRTDLTDKTNLNVIANYIDLKAYIPSSLDRETYESNPRAAATSWKNAEGFEDYYKILTGIGINHQFRESVGLFANVFFSTRDSYERRPFNILVENTQALGGRAGSSYSRKWNNIQLDAMAGVEYFIDFYKWKTYEIIEKEQGPLLTDNKETRENINIFIKSDFTFPSKTYFSLGLNINRTNYTYADLYSLDSEDNSGNYQFGTILSPRIGITQTLCDAINAYTNISHGFSPPTLAETLTPDGSINPEIRPETGWNYEIGSKGQILSNRFYYDIVFFSMRIRNLIVARRTGNDAFVGINAGETTHNGIEMTLNYDFLRSEITEKNLYGFITYTLADYKFDEFIDDDNNYSGNELTGVPRHVLNTGISFHTKPGLYGNLNYQFVDEMPLRDDNSVYSDAYQLVNLKLGYNKSLSDRFRLDLYGIINNLLDTHYASMIMVNASSFGGNDPRYYYPGLPRNYYLGAEVSYQF